MKTLLIVLLILPGMLLADPGLPDQPYIYVEGRAEIEKRAEIVTLRFDVVARAAQLQKANAEVQAKANKIFATLKDRKIDDNDIIAQDLRSEPQFDNKENYSNRGKVIGYAAMRPFQVKVHGIDIFPKLVDDLVALGGVEFGEINGGLEKEDKVKDEMWDKAVTNAREQAEKTLKAMNMKIDSVFANFAGANPGNHVDHLS
jgi:uncharacterized protein YggE